MKNYALDTSLLPKVWIYWESQEGTIYMNGESGERQNYPEPWMTTRCYKYGEDDDKSKVHEGFSWRDKDKPFGWIKNGSNLIYAYAKYHEDIERLEVAAVKYDTTRGKYAHEWKFAGSRFFIGKDKTCILDDNSAFGGTWGTYVANHYVQYVKNMLQVLGRMRSNQYFAEEFKKFIGADYFLIGNGNTVEIKGCWDLLKWFETTQKMPGDGKEQKLVNRLTNIPLGSIEGLAEKYPEKETGSYYKIRDIAYFEKINDNWCVLRILCRDENNSLNETQRIYIGDNGTTRIASKSKVGWVPSKQTFHRYWSGCVYIANMDEAIAQCQRIKYALSNSQLDDSDVVDYLTTSLRFPEIEQLSKFGYFRSARQIATQPNAIQNLKELFGGYYNEKEKNLLRKVGMTKPQLDIYMRYYEEGPNSNRFCYEYRYALNEMRIMFGNDLTYLDPDSFEKYLLGCKEWKYFRDYADRYVFEYLNIDKMRLFKNLVRLKNKNSNIFTIVRDAICTYKQLDVEHRIDVNWYFDNASDAIRVHDAVVELLRLQNEERRAMWNMQESERRKKEEEKRKQLDKERKIYEYEDNEYIIRLPKDAAEIASEGNKQHICIGSYVSRHSIGDTNLFFLRCKSNPDEPFYAIEMNNSKNIVQIHGFGNRWLGNNPEAIPTVIRWLRKNDIKCSDNILTCTATGYGQTNNYVAMPAI